MEAQSSESFARVVSRLVQRVEEWIIATGIIAVAAITIVNVFFRTVLNSSLTFAEELSQFFMILVTFIGIGYAASKGRHIRMSALYDQLGVSGRKALMVLISATTAILLFVLAWYSLRYISAVYTLGTVSPALQVPLYLVYCAAPLGLVLGGVQYVLTLYRNLTDPDVWLAFDKRDEYEEAPGGW